MRAALIVDGDQLFAMLGSQYAPVGTDRSLLRGRAGLATLQARAYSMTCMWPAPPSSPCSAGTGVSGVAAPKSI